MIYSGGFFPDSDRSHMETLRGIAARDLGRVNLPFRDSRLPEMLFRYRARNYPETLNETENTKWREFCRSRLEDPEALEKFSQSLEEVRASDLPGREEIISELTEYAPAFALLLHSLPQAPYYFHSGTTAPDVLQEHGYR